MAALDRWHDAVSQARARSVLVAVVGDSIVQGHCADSRVVAGRVRPPIGFVDRLARLLADRFNSRGHGQGWIEVESVGGPFTYGWDLVEGRADLCGLGGWGRALSDGEQLANAELCDGIDLYFTALADGAAPVDVFIDGVFCERLDTGNAPSGTERSGNRWSSGPLPWGEHELRVVCRGSGTAKIDGAYFHAGTAIVGVQVHRGGHMAWDTSKARCHGPSLDHLELNEPALVLWFTGINDYPRGPERYRDELAATLEELSRRLPLSSIGVIFPFSTRGRSGWDQFQLVAHEVSAAAGADCIDLFERIGDIGHPKDKRGLSVDWTHPNDDGHQRIAELILDALLEEVSEPLQGARLEDDRTSVG